MQRMIQRLARYGVRRVIVMLCLALGAAGASLVARSSNEPGAGYELTGRVVSKE